MRSLRLLLLPVLVGAVWLLTAATGQQPTLSTTTPDKEKKAPPKEPPLPSKPDDKATERLKEAVQALKSYSWVQTTLWQEVAAQGLMFRAKGRYLRGPDHQMHLDLQVRLGDTTGKLKAISDGTTLWETLSVGKNQQPRVVKYQLKDLLKTLENPSMLETVRAGFMQSQSFAGLAPLLENIQQQMVVTGQEQIRWHDRDVVRLTAYWSPNAIKAMIGSSENPWPPLVPKKCSLYLGDLGPKDAKPRRWWPYRIEWWGPPGDSLLVQMEYRDPKLEEPPAAQRAQLFRFNPGSAPVEDRTKMISDELIKANLAQKTRSR
jgi:hypothetical protein